MNTTKSIVPTAFAAETRFDLRLNPPPAPFRAAIETEFERLKSRLLARELADAAPDLNAPLRRAANEAAALAWVTPYPLLVFPALFEEKTATALRQAQRQARIYAGNRELVAA